VSVSHLMTVNQLKAGSFSCQFERRLTDAFDKIPSPILLPYSQFECLFSISVCVDHGDPTGEGPINRLTDLLYVARLAPA